MNFILKEQGMEMLSSSSHEFVSVVPVASFKSDWQVIQTRVVGRVLSDLVWVSIDSLAFGHCTKNALWCTVYIQEVSRLFE